jgi:hypothetical protein
LLYKSFESRHELKDHVYHEEQHQQWKKVKEAVKLAWEAEQQRRRVDHITWEYHIARAEEKNRRARVAKLEGMTSKTWPPP